MISSRALASKASLAILALIVGWAVFGIGALYRTHATRIETQDFLGDVLRLKVGVSGPDELKPLLSRYNGKWRGTPTSFAGSPCGVGAVVADFVFDNRWLHRFFLAPMTSFSASVYVKDDRVCFRSIGMSAAAKGFTGVDVEEFVKSPFGSSFASRLMLSRASIVIDTGAHGEQRAAAYSLNLNCLTSLQGCRSTREMAPVIWQNSHEVAPTLWKSRWDK